MLVKDLLREKVLKKPSGSGRKTVPELLSPAGDFTSAVAAIANGADAVYAGLKEGSARAAAGNFTFEELTELCRYAKPRQVKVYVALNILCFGDGEAERFAENAVRASECGADSVIIQDAGLLSILSGKRNKGELREDFRLHISTQAGIATPSGLTLMKELGADRVILPRELTLGEIAKLNAHAAEAGLELEVFAHGALCICLSGSCLMSSYAGGRSGNRGQCAQPCRLNYSLTRGGNIIRGSGSLLSPDDLCALPLLDRLAGTGVASVKIEGRLKTADYAAITARIYREALDSISEDRFSAFREEIMPDALRSLQTVFTRAGGGPGFLDGNPGRRHITSNGAGRRGALIGSSPGVRVTPPPSAGAAGLSFFSAEVDFGAGFASGAGAKPAAGGPDRAAAPLPVSPGDGVIFTDRGGETVASGIVNRIYDAAGSGSGGARRRLLVCGEPSAVRTSGELSVYLTYDKSLSAAAAATYGDGAENVKVPLFLDFHAAPGAPAVLRVSDANGVSVSVSSDIDVLQADASPLSEDGIRKQLGKMNGTCFYPYRTRVHADGGIFMPVSALNMLRRNALDEYRKALASGVVRPSAKPAEGSRSLPASFRRAVSSPSDVKKEKLRRVADACARGSSSLFFFFAGDIPAVAPSLVEDGTLCYLPWSLWNDPDGLERASSLIKSRGGLMIAYSPFLPFGKARAAFESSLGMICERADGVQVMNAGDLRLLAGGTDDLIICADHSLNVANGAHAALLRSLGADIVTLSPEYPDARIAAITEEYGFMAEVICRGPVPLMRIRHCIIGHGADDCRRCSGHPDGPGFVLADHKNEKYDIITLPEDADGNGCRFCSNLILPGRAFEPKAGSLSGNAEPGSFGTYGRKVIRRIQVFRPEADRKERPL